MRLERIYIGGLYPSRLTAQEVLERLEASYGNQVEIQDVHRGATYCQFHAVSLQPDVSAVDIITKLYNNVNWKGCKLRVEPAKPHFLERLQEEQRERRETAAAVADESSENVATSTIPRHLKLRYRYGEESWKVDTKPCQVTDWNSFARIRQKLEQKRRASGQQEGSSSSRTKGNRCVHLRFQTANGNLVRDKPLVNGTAPEVASSSEGTEESSSEDSSSSTSEEDGDESSEIDRVEPVGGTYVWSSDEEDESMMEATTDTRQPSVSRLKDVSTLDEFASGINVSSTVDDLARVDTAPSDSEANVDFQQDNDMNRKVLANLFPDMATTLEPKPAGHDEKTKTAPVSMMRFDPTSSSAQQFIVATDNVENNDEAAVDESGGEDDDSLPAQKEPATEPMNDVYRQGKLEDVFRQARDSKPTSLVVDPTKGEKPEPSGLFSFSFNVGGDSGSTSKPEPVSNSATPSSSNVEASEPHDDTEKPTTETMTQEDTQSRPNRRRRGLGFPAEEDLDKYVRSFYLLNDGQRIMNDLEGYRQDDSVKEHWLKEREALTKDWKRKRKYAQSKRQKRHN